MSESTQAGLLSPLQPGLSVTVFTWAGAQPVHSKNMIVRITREQMKIHCSFCVCAHADTHTHTQPSIHFIASIHSLNNPFFPTSSPLFHFPTSNCSAGFSSFKFIAFLAFHLLSEWLDIYLCTVLSLITCSSLPAPSCVCAPQSMQWDEMALTAETQPPIYL